MLPHDGSRLAAIRDFLTWRAAIETIVGQLDTRITRVGAGTASSARSSSFARSAPVTSEAAGEAFVWLGVDPPYGCLPVTGQLLATDDYPYLYAAVQDTYRQPDDPADTFRLPDLGTPPAGVWLVRT